jgi:CheY-like chemotaxis protein
MLNKVVIVDDSLFDCTLIERVVTNYSFAARVTSFYSAKVALAYLHSVQHDPEEFPAMILLDINMPMMNGFEFMDRYMELPGEVFDRSIVIMISSTFKIEDSERMSRYPIVKRFVYKPVSARTLEELQEVYLINR